jgi:acyl carrier protein
MSQNAEAFEPKSERAIGSFLIGTLAVLLEKDRESLDEHTKFSDFGLDSVTGLQLLGHLEQEFARSYDPSVIMSHPTVASLARFLARDQVRK